ncbi:MAG: hypothetical protein NZ901_06170 [Geminocystis sp.]|nr:hypothetical protein [Geminocystis sp.]HIK38419.1 hypothetical protein [Geminocystis sp. M7585_C2015_104]MCS7147764.1 hypothetical protein [Geminocystis sp.]MCX8079216.1 hypothetical protein [Geminocystis sp.]MDW8116662.1 hypothetical protein [Geminocystis sp.]
MFLLYFPTPTPPAFALVRKIQEAPGVLLIQARHFPRKSPGFALIVSNNRQWPGWLPLATPATVVAE